MIAVVVPVATASSATTAATTAAVVVLVVSLVRWRAPVVSVPAVALVKPGRWRWRAVPEVFVVPIVHVLLRMVLVVLLLLLHRVRPPNEVILEHVRMRLSHVWCHVVRHVHLAHHWRSCGRRSIVSTYRAHSSGWEHSWQ